MENKKEITHEEIFNENKKAKLKEFIDKFKGQELFKKSNDRAREILANIKELPKVCNDCNTALESCTCIEDTLEMKDDTLEESEFCYYSGLPSHKAYDEETKCYCGHTTTCDCGPETLKEKLDKIVSKEPSKFWKESDERFKNKETLEEAKYRVYKDYWNEYHTQLTKSNFLTAFKLGAKWQQERSYSEEEVIELLASYAEWTINGDCLYYEWFEQFKKN
jgi:hypothetical protein